MKMNQLESLFRCSGSCCFFKIVLSKRLLDGETILEFWKKKNGLVHDGVVKWRSAGKSHLDGSLVGESLLMLPLLHPLSLLTSAALPKLLLAMPVEKKRENLITITSFLIKHLRAI